MDTRLDEGQRANEGCILHLMGGDTRGQEKKEKSGYKVLYSSRSSSEVLMRKKAVAGILSMSLEVVTD